MSRFVLVTADAGFDERVRLAAAGLPGSLQAFPADYLPSTLDEMFGQLVGEPLEVLVLGPDLPSTEVMNFAAAVDVRLPHVSVVYAASASPDLAIAAMRSGVRDLVSPDADVESLRTHLEQAAMAATFRISTAGAGVAPGSAENMNQGRGRVITVMSPKGGVGKTTIATNIAVGLAKSSPMSVVILDLDLQFGDVASGLMMKPDHSIVDAVRGPMDALSLKTYLVPHPTKLYALCAPLNPADADQVSAEQVGDLVARLASEFQYVVIDTSPGLGEHVLAALDQATDVVWVCGMDLPSIRGLRSGLEILGELDMLPEHRHVVVNMADRKSGITVQDIEATISVPIDVILPRSKALPLATNRGVPALQDNLRDATVKGLRRLVDRFQPTWHDRDRKQMHRRVVFQ
jgi:pilus assembly protein CpaE